VNGSGKGATDTDKECKREESVWTNRRQGRIETLAVGNVTVTAYGLDWGSSPSGDRNFSLRHHCVQIGSVVQPSSHVMNTRDKAAGT
jgi:hypothetical protein